MTDEEGLPLREAVEWCGGLTVCEITRLLRLDGGHQAVEGDDHQSVSTVIAGHTGHDAQRPLVEGAIERTKCRLAESAGRRRHPAPTSRGGGRLERIEAAERRQPEHQSVQECVHGTNEDERQHRNAWRECRRYDKAEHELDQPEHGVDGAQLEQSPNRLALGWSTVHEPPDQQAGLTRSKTTP
jgi:hypothetical protein